MYQEILQNIINYWKNIIDDDAIDITPQSNLMDDLSLSSVEMLNSLLMLEDTYGVVIPEKSLRHMVTIEDVARVLTEIVQK
ncbi:MAG: acyl carrier protein [Oscillospiraceae bacterium]|nr:acyl carrier protein [Oscillospiraceae bacterium]